MDGYYNPSDRSEIAKRAEQAKTDARSRVFAKLAEQARKTHDAEGLAFAAIRPFERGGREDLNSAALADEAVSLDPRLTWIYAMVVDRIGPYRKWMTGPANSSSSIRRMRFPIS